MGVVSNISTDRDASEDIAHELELRIGPENYEVSDALKDFIESNIGHSIGVPLPLREDWMLKEKQN